MPYTRLGREGYVRRRIKHSARVYVEGDTHTQTIDGFFGLFKNAVRGVHHGGVTPARGVHSFDLGAQLPNKANRTALVERACARSTIRDAWKTGSLPTVGTGRAGGRTLTNTAATTLLTRTSVKRRSETRVRRGPT